MICEASRPIGFGSLKKSRRSGRLARRDRVGTSGVDAAGTVDSSPLFALCPPKMESLSIGDDPMGVLATKLGAVSGNDDDKLDMTAVSLQ